MISFYANQGHKRLRKLNKKTLASTINWKETLVSAMMLWTKLQKISCKSWQNQLGLSNHFHRPMAICLAETIADKKSQWLQQWERRVTTFSKISWRWSRQTICCSLLKSRFRAWIISSLSLWRLKKARLPRLRKRRMLGKKFSSEELLWA